MLLIGRECSGWIVFRLGVGVGPNESRVTCGRVAQRSEWRAVVCWLLPRGRVCVDAVVINGMEITSQVGYVKRLGVFAFYQ